MLLIESDTLKIWEDVKIMSGFSLLQANTTFEMRPGSEIKSPRLNSCNYVHDDADMFTCMDKNEKEADSLDYGKIVQRFSDQFPKYGGHSIKNLHFENIMGGIRANYTSYIISMNDAKFEKSSLIGSRVGICAANASIKDTNIDTSGKGCPSDWGFGRGLKYATCAGSGGANGGRGGYGGIEDSTGNHIESCK